MTDKLDDFDHGYSFEQLSKLKETVKEYVIQKTKICSRQKFKALDGIHFEIENVLPGPTLPPSSLNITEEHLVELKQTYEKHLVLHKMLIQKQNFAVDRIIDAI